MENKGLSPDAEPLTNEETKAAVTELVSFYPKIVRTNTDLALMNQSCANMSFMLFKEPKKLETGKNVYGYIKIRGCWADEFHAKREATKIIKEIDSKNKIRIGPVGCWLPITDEEAFIKEMLDVKDQNQEVQLRDQAMKDRESEENKIIRELREREAQVKAGDIYDDEETLNFYTMKRVTEMRLIENIDIFTAKLQDFTEKLQITRRLLKKMDVNHPEYDACWIENYNIERKKTGIPNFMPSDKMLEDYKNWKDPNDNAKN